MFQRLIAGAIVGGIALAFACCKPTNRKAGGESSADQASPDRNAETAVTLVFTYGSEKQKWIESVTQDFHAAGLKTMDGRRIRVQALPMGSG